MFNRLYNDSDSIVSNILEVNGHVKCKVLSLVSRWLHGFAERIVLKAETPSLCLGVPDFIVID
jgi:hypothetical protein